MLKLKIKSIIKTIYRSILLFTLGGNIAFALDVNTATQTELDTIKGIGPIKAKAIIEERSKRGNFKDITDLSKRVKGIGEKSIVNLQKNGLTVGANTNITQNTKIIKSGNNNYSSSNSSTSSITQKPSISGISEPQTAKSVLNNEISKPIIIKKDAKHEEEKNQQLKHKITNNASSTIIKP